MKKLIILLFSVGTINAFSQVSNIKVLLGYNEYQVQNYFDSLNALRNNIMKVQRTVTASGNLALICYLPLDDEKYYSCSIILAKFLRLEDNREYCYFERITGDIENADRNLNYVKDHFTLINTNEWEKPMPGYTVTANFNKITGVAPIYHLDYYFKSTK